MSADVGKMIREARQARGISLRQLASQVGIHFSHLSKIENGKDQLAVIRCLGLLKSLVSILI